MQDSRFVTLLASSDESLFDSLGIVVSSGQFVLGAVVGGLEAAGSDAKSVLVFLNDMSGYMLNKASGGYLFRQEALNFANTINEFVDGIAYLVQHADEVGPTLVAGLEKKWNDYLAAFEAEDHYQAGKLYGELFYQISMLFVAGQGVAKSVLSGLKSVAPKFAATVEAAGAARGARVGDEAVDAVNAIKRLEVPESLSKNIHSGQQGKHILGHNNFVPGRSPLIEGIDPQKLLDGIHLGQYPIVRVTPRSQPIVDFGFPIGLYEGNPTRYGIIHSGRNGAHIVPANPLQF